MSSQERLSARKSSCKTCSLELWATSNLPTANSSRVMLRKVILDLEVGVEVEVEGKTNALEIFLGEFH